MNTHIDVNLAPLNTAPKTAPKRSSFLRHTTALFLVLAGGLSMVLFSVKYQVHDLEAEHQRLVLELDDERRALHVLRAEWANLNDPKRIKKLAEQHLGMQAMRPNQVMSLEGLQTLPVREIISPTAEEVIDEIQ
ncbi:MAG: cell division protein FtsL [Rhodospirillaceae bacterium]|nr:MAG: cell division protein FtsL [Rhodospirillaceae bacterium]